MCCLSSQSAPTFSQLPPVLLFLFFAFRPLKCAAIHSLFTAGTVIISALPFSGYPSCIPPSERKDHYLSTDRGYVHKIAAASAEEPPFATATPRQVAKWRMSGQGGTTRETRAKGGPPSQCRDSHPPPSNKHLKFTGDKHHFWLPVWEKISPESPYLTTSKAVVASASLNQ